MEPAGIVVWCVVWGEWRVVPMSSVTTHCPFLPLPFTPWLLLLGGNAEMISPDCWWNDGDTTHHSLAQLSFLSALYNISL